MGTLIVTANELSLQYDIHSLVQAFFPGEEVRVVPDTEELSSTEGLPDIRLLFSEDTILLSVIPSDGERAPEVLKTETNGITDRGAIKNLTKQLLYYGLNRSTGRRLPWGALTGIRPVKLVRDLMREATEEELADYMKTVYLISDEKLALSMEIARREQGIIDALHKDGYSLYLGIPFCPTTCLYCSFASYPVGAHTADIEPYLNALFKEIDFVKDTFAGRPLDTVYIGGGTPTALSPEALRRLLFKLSESLDLSGVQELTVEAGRPDSITREKLSVLREYGVSRISINPQTMNPETLRLIGRLHTVEEIREKFYLARELSFDNINMDIILGLPGEGETEVMRTMQELKALSPDSLTVHSLAVKRASRLKQWSEENGIAGLQNSERIMTIAAEGAREMGLLPYYLYRQKNMAGNLENTGFAHAGKFGIYNVAMMEEVQDIPALGAGTVSKRLYPDGRIKRCDTVKELSQYIGRIDEMLARKRALFCENEF